MTTRTPRRDPVLPMPVTRRGKILFALGLLLWFSLLMLPCGLFWFASGNEIVLQHGSIPDPVSHPLLQIGTVMNAKERGMKITTSYITSQTDAQMCVQTNASYVLWQTSTNSPNASFCDCYARANDTWSLTTTTSGTCP